MRDTLAKVMPALRAHEGGWANHPKDPGGATMFGVTQAVYDDWRVDHGKLKQTVRDITEDEVRSIFKVRFWDRIKGDDLPTGIDYATFDAAVNSGPARGAKWLQKAVGADVDGKVGALTVRAAWRPDPVVVIRAICANRLGFVQSLKTFRVFGKGWTRRVAEVEALAIKLARETIGFSQTGTKAAAQSDSERATAQQHAEQGKAASAGGGAVVTTGGQLADPAGIADWLPVAMWLGFGALAVLVALYAWRAYVSRARAAAAMAVATGTLA
jgi:lysozyme family protein